MDLIAINANSTRYRRNANTLHLVFQSRQQLASPALILLVRNSPNGVARMDGWILLRDADATKSGLPPLPKPPHIPEGQTQEGGQWPMHQP